MRIALSIFAIFLSGCTTFYHNGQKVFSTSANVTGLVITKDGDLRADRIDSSTPIRAYGSVIGTATAGTVPIIMSLGSASKGKIRNLINR